MGKILFANFLEDKRVYHLAYLFWKSFFERFTAAAEWEYVTYLNTDGEHDGNPIFHAYIPASKRALRIIQVDPSEAEAPLDIKAWIDEVQPASGQSAVPELVINMILSEEAKKVGQNLIHHWFHNNEVWTEQALAAFLPSDV